MKRIAEFTVSESEGSTHPESFFPTGKVTRVDSLFREAVTKNGPVFESGRFRGQLLEMPEIPFESLRINSGQFCSLLTFLSSEGSKFLEPPEGEDEENIVLGLGNVDGEDIVLYAEQDNGKIHLHAAKPNGPDPRIVKFFVVG